MDDTIFLPHIHASVALGASEIVNQLYDSQELLKLST